MMGSPLFHVAPQGAVIEPQRITMLPPTGQMAAAAGPSFGVKPNALMPQSSQNTTVTNHQQFPHQFGAYHHTPQILHPAPVPDERARQTSAWRSPWSPVSLNQRPIPTTTGPPAPPVIKDPSPFYQAGRSPIAPPSGNFLAAAAAPTRVLPMTGVLRTVTSPPSTPANPALAYPYPAHAFANGMSTGAGANHLAVSPSPPPSRELPTTARSFESLVEAQRHAFGGAQSQNRRRLSPVLESPPNGFVNNARIPLGDRAAMLPGHVSGQALVSQGLRPPSVAVPPGTPQWMIQHAAIQEQYTRELRLAPQLQANIAVHNQWVAGPTATHLSLEPLSGIPNVGMPSPVGLADASDARHSMAHEPSRLLVPLSETPSRYHPTSAGPVHQTAAGIRNPTRPPEDSPGMNNLPVPPTQYRFGQRETHLSPDTLLSRDPRLGSPSVGVASHSEPSIRDTLPSGHFRGTTPQPRFLHPSLDSPEQRSFPRKQSSSRRYLKAPPTSTGSTHSDVSSAGKQPPSLLSRQVLARGLLLQEGTELEPVATRLVSAQQITEEVLPEHVAVTSAVTVTSAAGPVALEGFPTPNRSSGRSTANRLAATAANLYPNELRPPVFKRSPLPGSRPEFGTVGHVSPVPPATWRTDYNSVASAWNSTAISASALSAVPPPPSTRVPRAWSPEGFVPPPPHEQGRPDSSAVAGYQSPGGPARVRSKSTLASRPMLSVPQNSAGAQQQSAVNEPPEAADSLAVPQWPPADGPALCPPSTDPACLLPNARAFEYSVQPMPVTPNPAGGYGEYVSMDQSKSPYPGSLGGSSSAIPLRLDSSVMRAGNQSPSSVMLGADESMAEMKQKLDELQKAVRDLLLSQQKGTAASGNTTGATPTPAHRTRSAGTHPAPGPGQAKPRLANQIRSSEEPSSHNKPPAKKKSQQHPTDSRHRAPKSPVAKPAAAAGKAASSAAVTAKERMPDKEKISSLDATAPESESTRRDGRRDASAETPQHSDRGVVDKAANKISGARHPGAASGGTPCPPEPGAKASSRGRSLSNSSQRKEHEAPQHRDVENPSGRRKRTDHRQRTVSSQTPDSETSESRSRKSSDEDSVSVEIALRKRSRPTGSGKRSPSQPATSAHKVFRSRDSADKRVTVDAQGGPKKPTTEALTIKLPSKTASRIIGNLLHGGADLRGDSVRRKGHRRSHSSAVVNGGPHGGGSSTHKTRTELDASTGVLDSASVVSSSRPDMFTYSGGFAPNAWAAWAAMNAQFAAAALQGWPPGQPPGLMGELGAPRYPFEVLGTFPNFLTPPFVPAPMGGSRPESSPFSAATVAGSSPQPSAATRQADAEASGGSSPGGWCWIPPTAKGGSVKSPAPTRPRSPNDQPETASSFQALERARRDSENQIQHLDKAVEQLTSPAGSGYSSPSNNPAPMWGKDRYPIIGTPHRNVLAPPQQSRKKGDAAGSESVSRAPETPESTTTASGRPRRSVVIKGRPVRETLLTMRIDTFATTQGSSEDGGAVGGNSRNVNVVRIFKDPDLFALPELVTQSECAILLQSLETLWQDGDPFLGKELHKGSGADAVGQVFLSAGMDTRGGTIRIAPKLRNINTAFSRLERRLAAAAQCTLGQLDDLYGIKFSPGAFLGTRFYQPHRIKTIYVFLNSLAGRGGEVAFVNLGIQIKPKRGTALLWSNTGSTNDSEGDDETPLAMAHCDNPTDHDDKFVLVCHFSRQTSPAMDTR